MTITRVPITAVMSLGEARPVEPGGREPAPGALALVQRFVNTLDIEGHREELGDPGRLTAWLAANGLLEVDEQLGLADLQRAVEVREALRALLLANAGMDLDPGAIGALNRAAGNVRLVVRFDASGHSSLEPDSVGIERALARLLPIVHGAMGDGTWGRLKACRNDVCRWAFYDHSRNRSGRWCTMDDCGNALKARAYRRRRVGASVPKLEFESEAAGH
jgi:predicted RNA-binding Zn ribbon-like protein